ncbi:hypothetical protein LCGC14_1838320 [marine sediment metagenome]|uniref:Uncharacterized protein n=1 Tax=marine sediment metagenome TaxID=412755 RepID=A0A0F9JDB0_9ZZZZ
MNELCVSYGCTDMSQPGKDYCLDCDIVGDEE